MKLSDESEQIVIYTGNGNGNNLCHLIQKNSRFTFCGHCKAEMNQKGELDGRYIRPFRGQERVLGRLCKKCKKKISDGDRP